MDDADKELVRSRVSLIDLVGRYTTLRRSGNRYKALCPFHSERTPSFHVDPDKGLWHCYGSCSTGGDVFSFLMRAEGIGFREALERLADQAGIVLSAGGKSPDEAKRERDQRSRMLEANAAADSFFRECLRNTPEALAYCDGRGLDHDIRQRFHIGYAPDQWDSLARSFRSGSVELDDAEAAGLVQPGRRPGEWTDRFRDRLVFPIHDAQERVVGFGGRLIRPRENAPKYLNSPETPLFSKSRILYALPWARKAIAKLDQVVVVEGYMDAVAAHQAGFENVVATLGTSLTTDHVSTLARHTKNVVLSFDADEAGVRAALRAADTIRATGDDFRLKILALPAGDDPDSILRRGEHAAFRSAIATARSIAEFRIEALRRRCRIDDDEGRMEFLREAVVLISQLASPLEEDNLLRGLVPYHPLYTRGGGRAESALRAEVDNLRRRGRSSGEEPYRTSGSTWASGDGKQLYGRRLPWQRGDRQRNPSGTPFPLRERPIEPIRWGDAPYADARDRAEKTILRALLDPPLAALVRRHLEGSEIATLFHHDEHRALAQRLSKSDLGIETSLDVNLNALVSRLSLAGSVEEPLAESAVTECIEFLIQSRSREAAQRIMQQGTESPGQLDTDQLREWNRRLREQKGGQVD